MRTHLTRIALLVALVAPAAACVSGVEAQDTFQKSIETSGHLKLKITNISGDTCISRTPGTKAIVSARVTATAESLDEAQRIVDMVVKDPPIKQDADGTLRIGKLDKYEFGDAHHRWFGGLDIDYRLQLPEDSEVDAAVVSGHTCVEDLAGPVRVESVSGNVEVRNVGGAVHVEAVSGNVLVEKAPKATVRTTSGDITVSRVAGAVDAKAISGDLFLSDVGEQLAGRVTSGDIRVEGALPASARWQFELVSGDLRLTLPEDSAFHLETETRSGQLRSEFPIVTRQAGDDGLVGEVGQNPTARITTKSTSGDVHLQKKIGQ